MWMSGYLDYSLVFSEPDSPFLHGLRFGWADRVWQSKDNVLGIGLSATGIFNSSPEEQDITETRNRLEEVPCYDDEGNIITTQTCYDDVEEEVVIGSEVIPRTGFRGMVGLDATFNPKKNGKDGPVTVSASVSGGVVADKEVLGKVAPAFSGSLSVSYKF